MPQKNQQILHPAPLDTPMIKMTEDESVSVADSEKYLPHSSWARFLVNLNAVVNNFFPVRTVKNMNGVAHIGVPSVTRLTTTQRDAVDNTNWQNGDIIYNTTTNKFNFRENDAWKELP